MLDKVQTLDGHSDRIWTLAWNPAGTVLASSGSDKTIRLWAKDKADNWNCVSILTNTHIKSIRRLCWSPCGNYLASASFDATVCIWKRNSFDGTWTTLVNLEGHENEVKSVAWSSDGKFLASCGRDRTIWIWEKSTDEDQLDDAENWDCSDVKNDHSKDVKHIVWHPHHNILVSCSYDDTVKLFQKDGEDWNCFDTLTAHTSTVWSAAFSSSGRYLATSSDDKTVRVWKNHSHEKLPDVDANSWKCISAIQGYHSRSIYDVSWCQSDNVLASVSGDNSLAIYAREQSDQSQEGELFICVQRLSQAHDCDANCVAWNPKIADILATGGDDRKIKIWKYSPDNKGMKPLTVVETILRNLSLTTTKSNTCAPSDDCSQSNESRLVLEVTDISSLVKMTHLLQTLQNELQEDGEMRALENALNLKFARVGYMPIEMSNLTFDEHLKEFHVDIVGLDGEVGYRFRVVIDSPDFKLKVPRRSVKLTTLANDLFLLERTGDLFKIKANGESQLLLGHLFMFSDVQFVVNESQARILYIISADRDEKIRITNYPDTFDIERYCFGHKHLLRRIFVCNERRFVSIDQENQVCVWNLEALKKSPNASLVPERIITMDGSLVKRARVH